MMGGVGEEREGAGRAVSTVHVHMLLYPKGVKSIFPTHIRHWHHVMQPYTCCPTHARGPVRYPLLPAARWGRPLPGLACCSCTYPFRGQCLPFPFHLSHATRFWGHTPSPVGCGRSGPQTPGITLALQRGVDQSGPSLCIQNLLFGRAVCILFLFPWQVPHVSVSNHFLTTGLPTLGLVLGWVPEPPAQPLVL